MSTIQDALRGLLLEAVRGAVDASRVYEQRYSPGAGTAVCWRVTRQGGGFVGTYGLTVLAADPEAAEAERVSRIIEGGVSNERAPSRLSAGWVLSILPQTRETVWNEDAGLYECTTVYTAVAYNKEE